MCISTSSKEKYYYLAFAYNVTMVPQYCNLTYILLHWRTPIIMWYIFFCYVSGVYTSCSHLVLHLRCSTRTLRYLLRIWVFLEFQWNTSRYKIQDILFVLLCVQLHTYKTIHIWNLIHVVHLIHTYKIVKLRNFTFFNEHRNTFPYFYIITGFQ